MPRGQLTGQDDGPIDVDVDDREVVDAEGEKACPTAAPARLPRSTTFRSRRQVALGESGGEAGASVLWPTIRWSVKITG
jgi:hypothetical protein